VAQLAASDGRAQRQLVEAGAAAAVEAAMAAHSGNEGIQAYGAQAIASLITAAGPQQPRQQPLQVEDAAAPSAGRSAGRACARCGRGDNLKKCRRCMAVRYCSKECQTADWAAHKGACRG
jgi:MYND finger